MSVAKSTTAKRSTSSNSISSVSNTNEKKINSVDAIPHSPLQNEELKAADFNDNEATTVSVIGVPQARRPAATSMQKSMVWIYGPPKIGKTTFASQFPGTWFLATEAGQKFVDTHEPTLIRNWEHFTELGAFINENKPTRFGDGEPIHTLVIDTVDLLFRMCTDWVSHSLGVEDPSELDHGKGWSRLNSEWIRVMSTVAKWPYTLVCISHSREREFKTRNTKTNRIEPDIGAAGMRMLNAACDLILYCHSAQHAVLADDGAVTGEIKEQRLMLTHPTSWALAGGRMSHMLPEIVPLSYDELTKAFKNGAQPK